MNNLVKVYEHKKYVIVICKIWLLVTHFTKYLTQIPFMDNKNAKNKQTNKQMSIMGKCMSPQLIPEKCWYLERNVEF